MTRSTTAQRRETFHPSPKRHARRVEYPFPRGREKPDKKLEIPVPIHVGNVPKGRGKYKQDNRQEKKKKRRGIHPSILPFHPIPSVRGHQSVQSSKSHPKKQARNPKNKNWSSRSSYGPLASHPKFKCVCREVDIPYPKQILTENNNDKKKSLRSRVFVAEFVVVVVGEERKWSLKWVWVVVCLQMLFAFLSDRSEIQGVLGVCPRFVSW